MTSGEHQLWDVHMATGPARVPYTAVEAFVESIAEGFRRMAAAMRPLVRALEKVGAAAPEDMQQKRGQ